MSSFSCWKQKHIEEEDSYTARNQQIICLMWLHRAFHSWLKHRAGVTCTISQVNTSPRMTSLRQGHRIWFQAFSPDVQRSLSVRASVVPVDFFSKKEKKQGLFCPAAFHSWACKSQELMLLSFFSTTRIEICITGVKILDIINSCKNIITYDC